MNEATTTTDALSFDGDIAPILPEGWDGQSDIFADVQPEEEFDGADEFRADDDLSALLEEGEGEEAAPEAEPEAPTTEPEEEPQPEAQPSRTLKLKVNHEEKTVDLNAMSDDEIIALMQKGYAFDKVKDKERRETYDRVYQEELDLGMSERQARFAAEREAGGDYSKPEPDETASPNAEATPTRSTERDVAEELRQLRILRPNVKAMPDEVTKMIAQGINVTQAYLAWEADKTLKAASSLKKENEILKQNAASAARAPVSGVTGGGATTGKAKSAFEAAFEAGFDSGANW